MGKIENIKEIDVEQLKPYEKNAKLHGPEQVEKIANSIREFGFLNPVLIDKENNIIAGHGRLMAAKSLGMKTVPTVAVEGLTEEQRRAYILADNRLTELGEWDQNILTSELQEIENLDFDSSLTGFDLEVFNDEDFGTEFSLPEGEKPNINTMTFTVAIEQLDAIETALGITYESVRETYGNENRNGNALYELILQWEEMRAEDGEN